jgi:hypothetical protein
VVECGGREKRTGIGICTEGEDSDCCVTAFEKNVEQE